MTLIRALALSLLCCGVAGAGRAAEPVVQVGLDRVDKGAATVLREKRVGLIVHASSRLERIERQSPVGACVWPTQVHDELDQHCSGAEIRHSPGVQTNPVWVERSRHG